MAKCPQTFMGYVRATGLPLPREAPPLGAGPPPTCFLLERGSTHRLPRDQGRTAAVGLLFVRGEGLCGSVWWPAPDRHRVSAGPSGTPPQPWPCCGSWAAAGGMRREETQLGSPGDAGGRREKKQLSRLLTTVTACIWMNKIFDF